MNIWFKSELEKFLLEDQDIIIDWLYRIADEEGKKVGEIGYIFVGKERILSINNEFLGHNYYTDIITFDNSYLSLLEGEIFICIPIVRENSLTNSEGNFELELFRVVVHGLLHLIGYKDKSLKEQALMRRTEDQYLSYLFNN